MGQIWGQAWLGWAATPTDMHKSQDRVWAKLQHLPMKAENTGMPNWAAPPASTFKTHGWEQAQ